MADESTIPLTTEQLKDLLAKVTPGEWRKEAMGGSSTVLTQAMPPRNDQRANYPYGFRGGEFCVAYPFIEDDGKSFRPDFVCFGHADATLISLAPTLAAEVVRLREALYEPKYEHLDAACYGVNCFPDELEFILEKYRQALDATNTTD